MATLVLSTVGSALGGPVGGAIGSLLGQTIDQQLLGPGPRHGPRLGDLSVQTSSYGTAIPKLFGRMRVAGSVIWATDLQESSVTQAAKGDPGSVAYSYSVSLAVALSSRPIIAIKRIWADGKLIRDAAGEFSVSTAFRYTTGSEDAEPDALISSIEGIATTPAYRGTALAIFEHLELAEFGNRIPFLTFEVEADEGRVALGDILRDSSDRTIDCNDDREIVGFAAYGSSMAAALEQLVVAYGVRLSDDGERLVSPGAEVCEVTDAELGCSAETSPSPSRETSHVPARHVPSRVELSYYEPDRDFQKGIAQAALHNAAATSERIELPAVLEAAEAKALAETILGRKWAEREQLTLRLPPRFADLRAGAAIVSAADGRPWLAKRITIERLAVIAELQPSYATSAPVSADPGRPAPSVLDAPGATSIALVELAEAAGAANAPVVAIAATSGSGRWRPVPLAVEVNGQPLQLRSSASRAIIGQTETALPMGQALVVENKSSVVVNLARPDDWLESRDDDALVNGANLAMIGREIIQFGRAEALGEGRFLLSRLVRGRRGTEWAMAGHQAGDQFVMLDPATLITVPLASSCVGATIRVEPEGLRDDDHRAVAILVTGEALRPLSPAHFSASIDNSGALHCSWERRSRRGWAWLDEVDVPLDAAETYRVTAEGTSGSAAVTTDKCTASFEPSQIAALGGPPFEVSVVAVGDLATSPAARISITSN